ASSLQRRQSTRWARDPGFAATRASSAQADAHFEHPPGVMAHGLEDLGSLVEADDGIQDALRAQLAAPKELGAGLLRTALVPQGVIAIGVAPIGTGLAGHD